MILGLWAPEGGGWGYWCLRNIYPIFIYFLILYPWTTFITQEAYWSVPVFLFINLHLSGIFAYRSARRYWRQNHLVTFITSTFIPYYDDIHEFEQRYRRQSIINNNDSLLDGYNDTDDRDIWDSPRKTLAQGFQQRYRKDNRKRKRNARLTYHVNDDDLNKKNRKKRNKKKKTDDDASFDIHESLKNIRKNTEDPFRKHEENLSSWASIAGSENKLSVSLFYEAIQRMWWRFWGLTTLTAIPIIVILSIEMLSPDMENSISTNSSIQSPIFIHIFVPFNIIIQFVRIFYTICEFVFMAFYFQFICECHRGDLLIHLHYYDTSDIDQKYKDIISNLSQRNNSSQYESILKYYEALEFRLASIVWDWDRIAASTRDTSRAFRWWIFVMVVFNFIAGITAIINLTTQSLQQFPNHLEMYLPAVVNLFVSFYILLIGTKVAHLNKTVNRRTYFLLATTHFAHIEISTNDSNNNDDDISVLSRDRSVIGSSRSPLLSSVAINIPQINDEEEMSVNGDKHGHGFGVAFSPNTPNTNSNGSINFDNNINAGMKSNNNNNNNININNKYQQIQVSASIESMELEIRKQNLYIQAQTVSRAATSREIGISVYGMVLNRNLFLGFFSPFVAFFLFCINTWLPNQN